MVNVLDLDFSEKRVQQATAQLIGTAARSLYDASPKRALVGYGGLLLGLGLWLSPLSQKLNPRVTLPFTIAAAAAIAISQSKLEDLQDDIDEADDDKALRRALKQSSVEAVETTRHYAQTAQSRLAHSQTLPAHLIEPDLLPAEGQPALPMGKPSIAEFEAFLGESPAAPANPSSEVEASPAIAHDYKFGTRKNAQTGLTETTVDLAGLTEYAGLPIVDLAFDMAVDSRGCMGIGSTGCGKSELLKQAIAAQYKLDENSDFTIFAHKSANTSRGESLDYAGLERSKDCFVFTASQTGDRLSSAAFAFESQLNALNNLIESGSAVPSVVVIDQSNQGLMACDKAAREAKREFDNDEEAKGQPDFKYLKEDYQSFINTVLVDGREKLVKAWTFGHANTNKSTGVEHQVKQNIFFVGLGRAGNYAAAWNPLKSDLFIADKFKREELSNQLSQYLQKHESYGAPANVVIAVTNCGNQGWRVIVLPQYAPVQPIGLSVVNPALDESDENFTPEAVTVTEDQSIEAARKQLEKSAGYTEQQVSTARAFVKWFQINHRTQLDSRGYLDPQSTWADFPDTRSPSELEICLQILADQGAGKFSTDPTTGNLKWKPSDRLIPKAEQRPRAIVKNAPAVTQTTTLISKEALAAIFEHLENKQVGAIYTPKGFLDSSSKLRPLHGITSEQLQTVLDYLEKKGVVQTIGQRKQQFQYLGVSQ